MAEVQKVIVQIEADTDAAKAEVNSFRKAIEDGIGDALQEMGVEADKFEQGLKELSKTGTEGFKSLRTQIKEAKTEAQGLAQKFGETSKEALNAQKKVAMLTEEMNDFNDRVKALNPEAKFTAAANSIQGMIGAVQGVTGALQLFGGESEQVEKIAQKLQGALNLAQGINSVMGLKDAFANLKVSLGLATVAQEAMTTAEVAGTTATRGLTAALASNPFTAAAVAIAAVVAAVVAYTAATEDNTEAVDINNKETEEAIENQRRLAEAYENTSIASSRSIQDQRLKLALARGQIDELQAKLEQLELNRQRAVQEFIKQYGDDIVGIAEINKKFGLEAQLIRAEEAAKKIKNTSKEASVEAIKLMQAISIGAVKSNDELLKLSTEGFQKLEDVFKILESSPYEVKKAVEDLKRSLEGLQPIYADLAKKSTEIKPVGWDEDIKKIDAQETAVNDYLNTATQAISVIGQFQTNANQKELRDLEEKRKQGLITEEKYNKEVLKIKRKQIITDRNIATFNIAINTAQAIMKAAADTANPVLIALMAALGAAQAIAVQSAPLPQFKKGTLNVGGGNLDADGGQHAIIHKGEAIIPKDRNVAYHPAIAAIYHKRISPREINSFVEAKLRGGKPSQVTARINSTDLYGLKAPDTVSIKNTAVLARQIGREIAGNINLRRQ